MSRWRQCRNNKKIVETDEGDGYFVARCWAPEIAASVVADHNARLDAKPVGWQWRSRIGSQEWSLFAKNRPDSHEQFEDRPLYTHPPDATAELATLRANLATVTAERDEAKDSLHYANGVADLAMKHRDIAEDALAKAKRDAWIAGTVALAEAIVRDKSKMDREMRSYAEYFSRLCDDLTPPAEAEGGRQAIKSCCDMSDAELAAEDAALEKRWQKFVEDTKDGEGHSGSPGEWIVERSEEVATEQRRRAGMRAEARRHDR